MRFFRVEMPKSWGACPIHCYLISLFPEPLFPNTEFLSIPHKTTIFRLGDTELQILYILGAGFQAEKIWEHKILWILGFEPKNKICRCNSAKIAIICFLQWRKQVIAFLELLCLFVKFEANKWLSHCLLLKNLRPGGAAAAGRRQQAADLEWRWRKESQAHQLATIYSWRALRSGFAKLN